MSVKAIFSNISRRLIFIFLFYIFLSSQIDQHRKINVNIKVIKTRVFFFEILNFQARLNFVMVAVAYKHCMISHNWTPPLSGALCHGLSSSQSHTNTHTVSTPLRQKCRQGPGGLPKWSLFLVLKILPLMGGLTVHSTLSKTETIVIGIICLS